MEEKGEVEIELTPEEEYNKQLEKFGKYLENMTLAGSILKKNGYQIFDVNQASQDFRKVMKLDEINSFSVKYCAVQDGKRAYKTLEINRQNYWNAFYETIWNKLDIQKKLLATEWLFEAIVKQYDINTRGLRYFPRTREEFNNCGYSSCDKRPIVFFNIDLTFFKQYDVYATINVIVHELEHIKQQMYISAVGSQKNNDFYTKYLENIYYYGILSDQGLLNLDREKQCQYYFCLPYEKSAELQSFKRILKYKELNEQKFGKNETINKNVDKYISEGLFDKGHREKPKNGKYYYYPASGIIYNERHTFNGHADVPMKIFMLRNLNSGLYFDADANLEQRKSELEKVKQNKTASQDELSKALHGVKEAKDRKIEIFNKDQKYKKAFNYFLKYNKLPKDFDKKEFDMLGIDDSKTVELPRYLKEFDKE